MIEHCDFDEQRRRATTTASLRPMSSCGYQARSRSSSTRRSRSSRTSTPCARTRPTTSARRDSSITRARCESTSSEARPEGVLAPVAGRHLSSSSCSFPTSRFCAQPTSRTRRWSSSPVREQRHSRVARRTLIGLLRPFATVWQQETIAESAREVQRPRTRAVQAARDQGGAHVDGSEVARRLGQGVQRDGRLAGAQVLVQARRFERHGITGIEQPSCADTAPDPAAGRGRARRPERDAARALWLPAPTQPERREHGTTSGRFHQ